MTKEIPFRVRRALADDHKLLADLGARTFNDTFAADNKPEDITNYLSANFSSEQQAAELADSHVTFLIAEINQLAIGYAMLRDSDAPACITTSKSIELVRLYASREWLGQGVGRTLMRTCISEARQAG